MTVTTSTAATALTGMLAGHELATSVIHRALHRTPIDTQVRAEQAMTTDLARTMAPTMVATLTSAVAPAVTAPAGRQRRGLPSPLVPSPLCWR